MSPSFLGRYSRLASPFTKQNCIRRVQLLGFSFSITTAAEEHDTPGRTGPPPIRVGITESAGRGVFATRRIGTGDLIHTAKPVLCHPSPSFVHSVCYLCLRKLRTLTNSEAYGASFCSEECKERAKGFCDVETNTNWIDFDEYCRYGGLFSCIKRLAPSMFQKPDHSKRNGKNRSRHFTPLNASHLWTRGLKYPYLVKRLACMVISGVASTDSLDILQPAALTLEMNLKMEEGFALLRDAFKNSLTADEDITFLTKQWYINVLARIRINAFRVDLTGGMYEDLLASAVASVEAEAAVGTAVYMLPSFYNHDCDPSAHIIWIDNADAKLKALRDVEEGEELRICYIDASMDRDARQELLLHGFGFKCNCSRCLNGD